MYIQNAVRPFGDRVVLIGDSGVSRLYKDGIGAAYRTAKAAATTAVFQGISADDFRSHYWPACRQLTTDNSIGEVVFMATRLIQKTRFARRAVLSMVSSEQQKNSGSQRMSTVLWDTFTGSAPYQDVFLRTLHPGFLGRFLWNIAISVWPF
jgi:flavin-dependent dehydrogenase